MDSYTPAEKRERRRLFRKGAWQAVSDSVDPRIEAKIQRIDQTAKERGARELRALQGKQEADRQAVATAKAALRTSRGTDRQTARDALKAAERQLRTTERVVYRAERS
ncbi:hypothetical protein ABZV68_13195 [Streptomyces clavifer]|uniref:hypothetical protein n=1 Tax=Streptomyces clavifer TaxID=68188 RepID=UPI0033B687D4